jgi:hypothetical protein
MSLPANAKVEAVESFVRTVNEAHDFLLLQDPTNAQRRYENLLVKISQAREHLRFNPEGGRPARFLEATTKQGRAVAARALALAAAHGVPSLREHIFKPYVLLYAHGPKRVVLLALKHDRQLQFNLE